MPQLKSVDRLGSKRIFCLTLLAVFALFGPPATAGDYTVTYAFDGREHVETGSAECEYRYYCTFKIENAGVSLLLGFRDVHHTSIGIRVSGVRRGDCCFFFDGVDSVSRDVRGSPLIRLSVYEGHPRRGNEFIQNPSIGVLYLKISRPR